MTFKRMTKRSGFATLEIMLIIALLFLVIQLSETARVWAFGIIDIKSWSRQSWFLANFIVVAILVVVRFKRDLSCYFSGFLETTFGGSKTRNRKPLETDVEIDAEYEKRKERDAEWASRAKKRLPYK